MIEPPDSANAVVTSQSVEALVKKGVAVAQVGSIGVEVLVKGPTLVKPRVTGQSVEVLIPHSPADAPIAADAPGVITGQRVEVLMRGVADPVVPRVSRQSVEMLVHGGIDTTAAVSRQTVQVLVPTGSVGTSNHTKVTQQLVEALVQSNEAASLAKISRQVIIALVKAASGPPASVTRHTLEVLRGPGVGDPSFHAFVGSQSIEVLVQSRAAKAEVTQQFIEALVHRNAGPASATQVFLEILTPYPAPAVPSVYVWNGTAWVPVTLRYWRGDAWAETDVQWWDGTAWRKIDVGD
jgi:hypothetical protein